MSLKRFDVGARDAAQRRAIYSFYGADVPGSDNHGTVQFGAFRADSAIGHNLEPSRGNSALTRARRQSCANRRKTMFAQVAA
jgi:hypothetical protein